MLQASGLTKFIPFSYLGPNPVFFFLFVLFCFDFSDWIFIIVFPFGSPCSLLEVCKGWWLFHACLLILARYNSISLDPWLCTLRGFRVEKSSLALEKSWGAHQRKCFIPFPKGSTGPQGLNSRPWCLLLLAGGFSFFFFFFVLTAELSWKPRNDFREPRFLHFPIHRKPLKSLPRNALFNSNPLIVQIPDLSCKNSYTCWPLPHPLRAVPWSYRRGRLPGLGIQQVQWATHNFAKLCYMLN